MAHLATIVQDICDEFGVIGQDDTALVEKLAGEAVVELLSEGEGMFPELMLTAELSILTTTRYYILPAKFKTASRTFIEVNDEGEYVADCLCDTKKSVVRKLNEGKYTGYRLSWVVKTVRDGTPGWYLRLAADAPEATTFEFDYYREPTPDDADLIENEAAVKEGVRSKVPVRINPDRRLNVEIYYRMKKGFKPRPGKFTGRCSVKPSRKTARHNAAMRRIARGG